MWATTSIHMEFKWWNEQRHLEQAFSFSATWPLWGELLCPVTMAWNLWSHQPTETFPFLSSLLGYLSKWKKIWQRFGHRIKKWWVLKEVLETCGWSLSLKKCVGLWNLVLWLPGERWDLFISNTFLPLAFITTYHREGSHCNWVDEEPPSTLETSVFWPK